MNEIVTGIFVAVVAGVLLSWLGFNRNTTLVHVGGTAHKSKLWKLLIILGSLMMVVGGYMGFAWGMQSGFDDYHTGLGLSLFIVGIPILLLGRFGSWWNRD